MDRATGHGVLPWWADVKMSGLCGHRRREEPVRQLDTPMKLSEPTIKALGKVITGDCDVGPLYRSGPELVRFFNAFGAEETYGQRFPSRWDFAEQMIRKFNNSGVITDIILAAINPAYFSKENPIDGAIQYLNRFLASDGYAILEDTKREAGVSDFINALSGSSSTITLGECLKSYKIVQIDLASRVTPETLATLSHEFIAQQIQKSQDKLATADFDGAITNARALVESVQEEIIRSSQCEVPAHKGDLGVLYRKGTQKVLSLDPSQADLETPLKQVLSGFNSIISGISGISNKMGDRHSRQYKPSLHHAKLAVNAALTLCEFLLDSYDYQRKNREAAEGKKHLTK